MSARSKTNEDEDEIGAGEVENIPFTHVLPPDTYTYVSAALAKLMALLMMDEGVLLVVNLILSDVSDVFSMCSHCPGGGGVIAKVSWVLERSINHSVALFMKGT